MLLVVEVLDRLEVEEAINRLGVGLRRGLAGRLFPIFRGDTVSHLLTAVDLATLCAVVDRRGQRHVLKLANVNLTQNLVKRTYLSIFHAWS